MTTKPAKRQKRDETMRQRIIDASIKFMSAHGSDKLSMIEVARIAKVARATVYNHFESKEALIEAAEYSLEDVMWERLRSEVSRSERIEEQVAAIAIFIARVWTDREHTPWYGFLSPTDEAILVASAASDHIRKLENFIEPLLVQAKKSKQLRPRLDIKLASHWVARLIYSYAVEHTDTNNTEPKRISKLFKSFLINGLGPSQQRI